MPATLVDKLLATITWTLVHSLWQGAILTVLAGLVVLLTRRSTAAFRYTFLCTLFFLFLGGVCFTFLVEWNQGINPTQNNIVTEQTSSYSILTIGHWRTRIAFFLNQNNQWIVLMWVLVLLFQSGRMVREMLYIRELRTCRTQAAEPLWKSKAQALAEELGIRKTVSLVESVVIKVPIVIGHLKPLVMVPVGMLNRLSPGEMEAVLIHELAHIRRHDYLVNYLQRIAETLLFFNPGLLWVSSLLRAEREACCDEIAIDRTGNKLQFVEALVRCKEHALQTPGFSLGLFGNRNVLLRRLNRIVSNRNQSLSPFEASFFGTSMLVLLLILAGWNERIEPSTTVTPVSTIARNSPVKEVIKQILEQGPQKGKKQIEISTKRARSASLGKRITPLKKQEHREEVSDNIEIDQQIPGLNSDHRQQIVVPMNDRLTTRDNVLTEEAERWRGHAERDRLESEKARQQAEINRAQAEKHRMQADRDRQKANEYRQQAQEDRLRAERDRVEVQKLREQANYRWQPEIVQ